MDILLFILFGKRNELGCRDKVTNNITDMPDENTQLCAIMGSY